MLIFYLVSLFSVFSTAQAVTVYGQIPLGQTVTAARPAQTVLAAYNDTQLTPPAVPNPAPARQFTLTLQREATAVNGLSIPHVGLSFFGFSIEMSVVTQVLGKNSSFIAPTFLNLMANLAARAGGVPIRIGGNTQEFAVMVDHLPNGRTFGKEDSGSTQTTRTPAVIYTRDMFYMCSNVSSFVNVKWFFGIPFNDSVNWRIAIAEEAQNIVGSNLLGLQAGNEPDFYVEFGRRTAPYEPADYANEVANLLTTIDANPRLPIKNNLLGPSVASGPWTPEQVWETGFIDRFKDRFYAFTVEHYPDNNCAAQFNTGAPIILPQTVFPSYLEHKVRVIDLVAPYINSANLAQQAGKPFIMFETNTASCGGFAGVSDTYGAALWATDYGFQMAYANFTHAMLHVGGQNAFYNPFTSPPTNQSSFNQWTVGAVYYSTIILAEAFGTTNTSRIIDLNANTGNVYTPAYAIYERGAISRVALFNYMNDPSGNTDLQVTLNIPTGNPTSVNVKYLRGPSVSAKYNITWAGQTMGNMYQVDGRFKGELSVTTIQCTQQGCVIPVPAPGFALVFLDNQAPALTIGQATQTFTTTRHTNLHNTATIDLSAVATSNGHSGKSREQLMSSNYGRVNSAAARGKVERSAMAMAGTYTLLVGVSWGLKTFMSS